MRKLNLYPIVINNALKIRFLSVALLFLAWTNSIYAQETDFEKTISELGLNTDDLVDWSNQKKITINTPTCAYVNISGISSLPPKKTSNYHAWLEFYDGNGNYFKKRIIINLQGKGSTKWPKKNYGFDFCEDEWVGDKTTDIKIGDWVKQDSYHIKAYYMDKFRGTGAIGYKIYDLIISGRGERPWNRANLSKPDVEARCTPDGFPAIIYFNGNFYGVYSWQLKKHRKNMNMDKKNPLQIHIDGNLSAEYIFSGSTIDWNQFEIRNPKNLYTVDGKEYDGDNPTEIMDETSQYFDLDTDDESVKEAKQNTAAVKHSIEQLHNHYTELNEFISTGASKEEIRREIERRFDVPSMIDYIIHNLLTNNIDGLARNWQWFTYDGYKWFTTPYDLDATFGYHTNYFVVMPPENYSAGYLSARTWKYAKNPLTFVETYFKEDIYEYYADIRNRGLLTSESVVSLFDNWYYAVGENNWTKEWEKWSSSPFTKETITNPNWKTHEWNNTVYRNISNYNANTTYNAGDLCKSNLRIWEATGTTKGVTPYAQIGNPDSIGRMYTWVPTHMYYLDKWMNYTSTNNIVSYCMLIPSSGWSTICIPISFDIPSGIEVFNVIDFIPETGMAKLEPVTTVEANKPYLVKGAPGQYQLIGEKVEGDASASDYLTNGLLHGTYIVINPKSDDYLLQSHQGIPGFYTAEGNNQTQISPNTAYLVLNTSLNKPEVVLLDTDNQIPDNVTIAISSAGYATYCSNFDLDFTNEKDIKAYVIFSYDNSSKVVRIARVDEVPAETGILVKGEEGKYCIPTMNATTSIVNMLVGTTREILLTVTDGDYTNFVLSSVDGHVGFYPISKATVFGANKAYLQVPTNIISVGANSLEFVIEDDDTSGIEDITNNQGGTDYYSLTGLKVEKPKRGIYISNGKKVVIM